MVTPKHIYESPDGGNTIRKRKFGSLETEVIQETMSEAVRHMLEDRLWRHIREAAKDNPALQDALEQALIIYELSRKNNE